MRKTKKIITVLFTLNLAVFSFYFYLFLNVREINGNTSLRLNEIKSFTTDNERARSIKNLLSDTKEERRRVGELFVQPSGSVDFIESVESLGRAAGVQLEIVSVGMEPIKGKFGTSTELFKLSLKAEGSWTSVIHLLSLLESMPFKVSFDGVNLQKTGEAAYSAKDKDKGQRSGYWKGDFSFRVLKIKDAEQNRASVN